MRVARIVPLRSLPRGKELYDYRIPEHLSDLRVHNLVDVPFRNRPLLSLVWSIHDIAESPYTLRDVRAIIDSRVHIDERQHSLVEWVIERYGGSRTHFILPLWATQKELSIPIRSKAHISTNAHDAERFILRTNDALSRIIESLDHTKGQTLILCPTIETVRAITQRLQALGRRTLIEFHSQLTARVRKEYTRVLLEDTQCIVVGTKLGAFLPWQHLSSIILTDAWSADYKHWDQEPRYDARAVAEYLSELHGCALRIFSPVQTLEQWHHSPLASIINNVRVEQCAANLYLENLEQEPHLFPLLEQVEQKKQTVLLLAPKKAASTIAYCQDCQLAYRCVACERLLSQESGSPTLQCAFCGQSKQTERCRSCSGTRIRASVNKLQRFLKDVHSAFPTIAIEYSLVHKQSPADSGVLLMSDETAITELNAQRWRASGAQPWTSILWWEPGHWFGAHQYRQNEEQFLFLKILQDLAEGEHINSMYLCGALSFARSTTPALILSESFYPAELKDRARFLYPPYQRLIRVDLHTHLRNASHAEEQRVMEAIRTQMPEIILEPTGNQQTRRRGFRFRQEWILKIPPEQMDETQQKLLNILPSSWSIDVDPQ